MSTYDFIVNQRELKAARHHDLESGRAKSTPKIKLKNNKVSPAIEVRDEDDRRVEVNTDEPSESSIETPGETTVKTISEVSSKAAKKNRNVANVEPESQESTSKQSASHIQMSNTPVALRALHRRSL